MDITDVHNAIAISGMPEEVVNDIWGMGEVDKKGLEKSLERFKKKHGV